jgi:predicted O-methyltransferase YrrM
MRNLMNALARANQYGGDPRSLFGRHWADRITRLDFRSGLGDSAWLLYGLCRSLKPAVAVEIGSARGKSACYVGMALKDNREGHLYAIDPHTQTNWNDVASIDTYEVMCKNVKSLGLADVVTIVRRPSAQAIEIIKQPIDLLFIDGDHSYEGVKSDWNTFSRHTSQFGLVVFHDTTWDLKHDPRWYRADMGVPRFVEELRQQGFPVVTIDRDCGVSIVQPTRGGVSLRDGQGPNG